VVAAPSYRIGVQNLLMNAGLGVFHPNTIAIQFPRQADDLPEREEERKTWLL
jgi:hypothetical protein